MSDGWPGYAALARELDDVRTTERARTEGLHVGVAQMTTHADELQVRLEAQHEHLLELSRHLRVRMPANGPVPPEGPVDPATDLTRVAETIDRADAEASEAAGRGVRPGLLPGWSPFGRAAAVYGAAAVVVGLAQTIGFLRDGTGTNGFLVLFVIPLACWLVAFTVLKAGGRTRVTEARPKQFTRFGLLLCLCVGPVLLVLALVVPRLLG